MSVGSHGENFEPAVDRFDRLYQPNKITEFDRHFAHPWATPSRAPQGVDGGRRKSAPGAGAGAEAAPAAGKEGGGSAGRKGRGGGLGAILEDQMQAMPASNNGVFPPEARPFAAGGGRNADSMSVVSSASGATGVTFSNYFQQHEGGKDDNTSVGGGAGIIKGKAVGGGGRREGSAPINYYMVCTEGGREGEGAAVFFPPVPSVHPILSEAASSLPQL